MIYILSGNARVTLADDQPVECGPGSVIRLPPRLDHHVEAIGTETLEMLIVYSPPLAPRDDVDV